MCNFLKVVQVCFLVLHYDLSTVYISSSLSHMFFNDQITYSRPRILVLLKALPFFFQKRQISTVELKLAPIFKAPDMLYIPGPIAFWPKGKVSSLLIVHPVQNPEVMSSILHSFSHSLQEKMYPTALGLTTTAASTATLVTDGDQARKQMALSPSPHPTTPTTLITPRHYF